MPPRSYFTWKQPLEGWIARALPRAYDRPMKDTLFLLPLTAFSLVSLDAAETAPPPALIGKATQIHDPETTLKNRVEVYAEIKTLLSFVTDQAKADKYAPRIGPLVKQSIILDRQWEAMEEGLPGDERRRLHNLYEHDMNTARNNAESEAFRIEHDGFYGSVPLRKALIGFPDQNE